MPRTANNAPANGSVIPKLLLAKEIARILETRELTQTEAARIIRDAPSQLSLIVNGRVAGFSSERLLRILTGLGRDVDIRIAAAKGRSGKIRVLVK